MEENLNKEANAASEQSNEQANVPVVSKGRQLLDELKKLDYNLAVLSNKPHDFTVAYINHLFKNYNFFLIYSQSSIFLIFCNFFPFFHYLFIYYQK